MNTANLEGLTAICTPKPQVLGKRGSRMVVDATAAPQVSDPGTGLTLFNPYDVFTRPTVAVGFGLPNTYLVFPNDAKDSWDKLNAFMFFRTRSYVAPTKNRIQSGVLFELVGLSDDITARVAENARRLSGRRSISCAHHVAAVLAESGFSSPGGSLQFVVRPSELAWLLWEHGLRHQGHPVELRPISTRTSPNDHFYDVWWKEVSAPARLVTKIIRRHHQLAAPVFPPSNYPPAREPVAGRMVNLGIARPSNFGAKAGVVFGEQPVYSVTIPQDLRGELTGPLSTPLTAYPGKLDPATKVKRYVLFSKPVVRSVKAMLEAEMEQYENIPAGLVPAMMRRSTREHRTAYRYNYVLTGSEMRVKRLASDSRREKRFTQWVLAKHVLLSGYSNDVLLAGEIWAFSNADGEVELVANANSGTYKPTLDRLASAADIVSTIFGVKVHLAGS